MDLETGTREMPQGENGELWVVGPQVMKGYLQQPEETGRNHPGRKRKTVAFDR